MSKKKHFISLLRPLFEELRDEFDFKDWGGSSELVVQSYLA